MARPYKVVDVFTREPMRGNPVAVVLEADGLDSDAMQRIARWTNLSETTFVMTPTQASACYRLRIFSPQRELPFAGHPTLGSAHAVLEAGIAVPSDGALVQECAVGLVPIRLGNERRLTLAMPSARTISLASSEENELEGILGVRLDRSTTAARVSIGAVWVVSQLPSVASLLTLKPNMPGLADFERRVGAMGLSLYAMYSSDSGAAMEVRSFAPSSGIEEDPVCGSGNGAIAAFRFARGLLPGGGESYLASQGQCMGRSGKVFVSVTGQGLVSIAGECVTCVDGELTI